MCELNRFVDLRDANGNGELLRGINRKLSHHGPDAEGYYEQGPASAGTSRRAAEARWRQAGDFA
jgi:asparagine synthetase B (glutamine-hydrolysing)